MSQLIQKNISKCFLQTSADPRSGLVPSVYLQKLQEQVSKSKKAISTNSSENDAEKRCNVNEMDRSVWKRIRASYFFMPSLLISTFIITYCIPNLILSFNSHQYYVLSDVVNQILFLAYDVGVVFDALIYILFLKDVRRFLTHRLLEKMWCFKTNDTSDVICTSLQI